MARPKNIQMQGIDILEKQFSRGKGTSKHSDKVRNNGKPAADKIYTDSTLKTYKQGWIKFCGFVKSRGLKTRDLSDLVPYVQVFADALEEQKYSAWSIHTWVCGVTKVLGLSLETCDLPKRERKNVKRSRNPVKSDVRFSPSNHQNLVTFCLCVGPRNFKELQKIRGSDLINLPDGRYAVQIKGKGGKERNAPVYGTPDQIEMIISLMREAGNELVFPHVPTAADIHAYRAEYACRLYMANARAVSDIPSDERYTCRKDMAGKVFDKRAMQVVSLALGHSRLSVIAQSYLWMLGDYT